MWKGWWLGRLVWNRMRVRKTGVEGVGVRKMGVEGVGVRKMGVEGDGS